MEIQIGNVYRVTDGDGDVTTLKVLYMDVHNEFVCDILASTCYSAGNIKFSQEDFDEMQDVRFIEGTKPPIEKNDTIKMSSALRQQYIEMALQTKDKKWFLELTSCKEGVC